MRQTLMATLIVLVGLTSGCDKISPFVDEAVRESVCDRDGDGLMRSTEYCAGIDCDDTDNTILDARGWFQDVDRDAYGAGEIEYHCIQPEGYQPIGGDCDDTEALVNPEAVEVCNEVDDDCDGQIDEENILTWYLDADHDTYGNPDVSQVICAQPEGYVLNNLDCDDTDAAISPDGTEICDDGIDQDCNSILDDSEDSEAWFADADLDSFGNPDVWFYSCEEEVEGYVLNDLDCDDEDLDVRPDASEACDDGIDNDCDGEIDTDAVDVEWYRDEDGDGYGDENQVLLDCSPPEGYVGNTGDCEDSLVDVNPEGTEVCNDWIDNDCDGTPGECELSGEILSSDADVVFTGRAAYDTFGSASCSIDFNGDGITDLAVGAKGVDTTSLYVGAVYLFLGPLTSSLSANDADTSIIGPSGSAVFGSSLICAADMTGNGINDLVIGAKGDSRVYILEGDSILPGEHNIDDVAAHTLVIGGLSTLGISTISDFDGDGLEELLLGSGTDSTSETGAGAVFLILSSDLAPGEQTASAIAYATYLGEEESDALGESVSGIEDIDGDGLPDLLMGAPGNDTSENNAGAAYLILSSSLVSGSQDIGTAAYAKFTGESAGDELGTSVFNPGDTDGDALCDIGVGAPESGSSGTVYIILSISLTSGTQGVLTASTTQLTGEASGDNAGMQPFGNTGDLNGDGLNDVLIGVIWNDAVNSNSGSTYLLYGPLPSGNLSLADADLIIRGQTNFGESGNYVSFTPDLNGDGYDELLSCEHYSGSSVQGRVLIFYGAGH